MSELKIRVEVAYALPDQQKILPIDVVPGTTVTEAINMSGIANLFPEIDPAVNKVGIFGKAVNNPETQELREGDRVEIYRPLKIDPKQARLNRAKKK